MKNAHAVFRRKLATAIKGMAAAELTSYQQQQTAEDGGPVINLQF
jgi:hypothetical protein